MIFKNLSIYQITNELNINEDKLQSNLEEFRFKKMQGQELKKMGWISPFAGGSKVLFHKIGFDYLLKFRQGEKILPTTVINEMVAEKSEMLEEKLSRAISKREKTQIKEDVIAELAPRAFNRYQDVFVVISKDLGLCLIDNVSKAKIDNILAYLHRSIDDFALMPLEIKKEPTAQMTNWLINSLEDKSLIVGDEAELREADAKGATLRCLRQDLYAKEIKEHLATDKQVVSIALTWDEKISFVVTENAWLKRLKATDIILEKREKASDKNSQLDSDFALQMGEFKKFLPKVISLFN